MIYRDDITVENWIKKWPVLTAFEWKCDCKADLTNPRPYQTKKNIGVEFDPCVSCGAGKITIAGYRDCNAELEMLQLLRGY